MVVPHTVLTVYSELHFLRVPGIILVMIQTPPRLSTMRTMVGSFLFIREKLNYERIKKTFTSI